MGLFQPEGWETAALLLAGMQTPVMAWSRAIGSLIQPLQSCAVILELMELIFEIRDAEEGGFYARALGHAIFTDVLPFEGLIARPRLVQMHYVRDELIPVQAA